MKSLSELQLEQAKTEIESLKEIVCGLYATSSFRSKDTLEWAGRASRIWVDNPQSRPKRPQSSRQQSTKTT